MDSSRPPPSPLIFFGSDLYSVSDRVDTGTAPQIAESSSHPLPPLVFAGSDPYTVSDRVDTSTASQIAPSPKMVQMAQMVCDSCCQLLSYPEGTRQAKCSSCETDNFVLGRLKLENETMAAFMVLNATAMHLSCLILFLLLTLTLKTTLHYFHYTPFHLKSSHIKLSRSIGAMDVGEFNVPVPYVKQVKEKPTTLDCGPRTICRRHIMAGSYLYECMWEALQQRIRMILINMQLTPYVL
ncbi:hypothetical protein PVK06_043126 [Gossypium arboreum]|uniref:Zinc finger LSD1-type domain-containing protein n=1 Tax=Gossypium arboreum TaxID=29729 RepID=A0ABR0MMW7_GOSAR|nr:hypothetical protein PVK06_043126 [Gossypium arboreum]